MDNIFSPKRLAVIGVSQRPTNLAKNILTNLHTFGFDGEIYPVGIRGGVINGMKIYRSVVDIPSEIDAAVILAPAATVPDYMEQCGEKGIEAVYIESGGFAEFGPQGKKLSERVRQIAEKYKIRVIGPNCIGVINTSNGLAVPFPPLDPVVSGPVSILSQSGGVGISYFQEFHNENVGIAKFVSLGNKLNTDEADLLPYLAQDPETKIICCYLEDISRGREFFSAAAQAGKPILIHKSNTGKLARKIAHSHTSAMITDDRIVEAGMNQAGIIRVDEVRKMIDNAKIFTLPLLKGPRLAIISRSGGHGVIAADACEEEGFKLNRFPKKIITETEKRMRANIIKLDNPMDLGDLFDLDTYEYILTETVKSDKFDGVVFLFAYYSQRNRDVPEKLLACLEKLTIKYDKPIALVLLSFESMARKLKSQFRFPIFTTTEETISALACSYKYYQWRTRKHHQPPQLKVEKKAAGQIISTARSEGRSQLSEDAFDILKAYGIRTVQSALVTSAEEAARTVIKLKGPAVMKIESPDIIHKTDAGGVVLDVVNGKQARLAYSQIIKKAKAFRPGARIDGVLIQPLVSGGHELILGIEHSPGFDSVILLGWGGTYTEIFKKSVLRMTPLSRFDAEQMISELKGSAILDGVRGKNPSDTAALADCLLRLSQLAVDHPEIRELDINPLVVLPRGQGAVAVDTRITIEKGK